MAAREAVPPIAADTAAVVVTHDGERYVEEQLDSILAQTLLPAVVLVVDDDSRDGTRALVREVARTSPVPIELLLTDGSGASDVKTRVASSFSIGLRAAEEYAIAVLSDQDDAWLPERLLRQRVRLLSTPGALLVAGDGILVDAGGHPVGGRLRDRFPLPGDWGLMAAPARMRASLRVPYVTGAASAFSRELTSLMLPVPRGWLHDRWATLVAAACGGLELQVEPVIRYRLHDRQVLGVSQAETGADGPRWRQVLARGGGPLDVAARARDVVRRVRPLATDPAVAAELSWGAVIRSGLDRP